MQLPIPTLVCAVAFSSLASSQIPDASASATDLSTATALTQGRDWRVPIHTMEDDPTFGAYGLWAAGRGYKVSFHDGMEFYPVLGKDAPRNLPVRWRTESVLIGDRELLEEARPEQLHDDWQFEYRSESVSEIYDVTSAGIEQSFVISRPLTGSGDGDLVVQGSLEGLLNPVLRPLRGTTQAAIELLDEEGREIVRYGEAIAFDAAGRRVEVTTSLEGNSVSLTVPSSWVAEATWPITIDPLLAPRTLASLHGLAAIESSDVAVRLGAAPRRVMTVFALPVSAGDTDTYAVLTDDDFGNRVFVFGDLQASFRTDDPSVAFVDNAGSDGRWTIAFARTSPTASRVRVYLHDGDSTSQNGTTLFLPQSVANHQDRRPDIGGARLGTQAMLAFEAELLAGMLPVPAVQVVRVDASAETFTPASRFDPAAGITGRPSVSQHGEGAPLRWMICAQRRLSPFGDPWTIVGRRIQSDGTGTAARTLVGSVSGEPFHAIEPSVDGNNTRYAVAYLRTDSSSSSTGVSLRARRFIWSGVAASPTLQWDVELDAANPALFQSLARPHVTADINVGNWAIAYLENNVLLSDDAIRVARIGFNGDVVESAPAHFSTTVDGASPAIAFDFTEKRFHVVYGLDNASSSVHGRVWTYPTDAVNTSYGTSCGGSFGAVTTPLVGTEFFRVRLTGALPSTTAALFVGFAPAALDLTPLGAIGCDLLVDPGAIITFPMTTDASGNALITIVGLLNPIDLYMQWLHVDFAANPFGILMTEGLRSQIR